MNRILFASMLILLLPATAFSGGATGSGPPAKTISEIFSRIDYKDITTAYDQPEPTFPVPEESFNELRDGLINANPNGTPSWLSQTRDGESVMVTPESYEFTTGTLNMNVGDMRIKLKSSSDDLLKQFKFDLDAVRRAQQAIKQP